ncbi:arylamine N-acetyltransferase [Streptomyces sp. LS1784]|uniref:arylamine N-acetyltransferase family protein n=1 Tax=Streptomyces sp. LS1784 TaxID=2851533 RepID=UPI001CCCE4C9|nr:arylamine N-acetyltransferase [Streptomyces sp. LS1784]
MDHAPHPEQPYPGLTTAQRTAYLDRIALPDPGAPSPEALARLQLAHLRAVPFENLSIHLGERVDLDPGALLTKVVTGRRGGFCYELNGVFAELLTSLGYRVSLLAARVHDGERLGPPFDHLALRVDLDEPWLVDVGFGRFSRSPLRLDERGEQADAEGAFTLVPVGEHDDLDVLMDGAPQYRLGLRPYRLADFAPTCWWQATSPDSHFTRSTACSLLTADGGRVTISGNRLITTTPAGERTERTLTDDEALAAYRTRFGITLDRLPALPG